MRSMKSLKAEEAKLLENLKEVRDLISELKARPLSNGDMVKVIKNDQAYFAEFASNGKSSVAGFTTLSVTHPLSLHNNDVCFVLGKYNGFVGNIYAVRRIDGARFIIDKEGLELIDD